MHFLNISLKTFKMLEIKKKHYLNFVYSEQLCLGGTVLISPSSGKIRYSFKNKFSIFIDLPILALLDLLKLIGNFILEAMFNLI